MNTTAAIFFLILGQADGFANVDRDLSEAGDLVLVPVHYQSLADCEAAGEAARASNQGLSFLSYTCVPATANIRPIKAEVKREAHATAIALKGVKCVEIRTP